MSTNWIQEALVLAHQAAQQDEVPVGAVLIQGDHIIGRGFNQRECTQSPVAHAEILALQEAAKNLGSWRMANCQMVVTLEPCLMCLAACQQARVEKLTYGAKDLKGGALSLGYAFHQDQRLNHQFLVQFEENLGCSKILRDFFSAKRNA